MSDEKYIVPCAWFPAPWFPVRWSLVPWEPKYESLPSAARFWEVCLKDFLCAFKLVFRKNVSHNFVGAWNRCARVFVRKILHSFASLVVVWCWTGSFVVLSLVGGILASPRWKRTQPVPFAVVRCVLHRRLCLVLWHQFLFVCPPWSWCCGIEGQRGLEMPWDWRSWCDWNTNIQTDKCTNV